MAMPPPRLDRHDLRVAVAARGGVGDAGRLLLQSPLNYQQQQQHEHQQALRSHPLPLPNHLLLPQPHQQILHPHHLLAADADLARMRQPALPPFIPHVGARIVASDPSIQTLGVTGVSSHQRLPETLRGHQSPALVESDVRWIGAEARGVYGLPRVDLQRLETPGLSYEPSLVGDDVMRLRHVLNQSRVFPFQQHQRQQAVRNEHEKLRMANAGCGGFPNPFGRVGFPGWESKLLDADQSISDARFPSLRAQNLPGQHGDSMLDYSSSKRLSDLQFLQPAAVYPPKSQENLRSNLLYLQKSQENLISNLSDSRDLSDSPALLSNKPYREESLLFNKEEAQRMKRLSSFGSGACESDLSSRERTDSAERDYQSLGASRAIGSTGTYRQAIEFPKQVSFGVSFSGDHTRGIGRDLSTNLVSNNSAAENDELEIGEIPANGILSSSVLSEKPRSPCLRYPSPAKRDSGEFMSTSERVQSRHTDHSDVKRHSESSKLHKSERKAPRAGSMQSRMRAVDESPALAPVKKASVKERLNLSPNNHGRGLDHTSRGKAKVSPNSHVRGLDQTHPGGKVNSSPNSHGRELDQTHPGVKVNLSPNSHGRELDQSHVSLPMEGGIGKSAVSGKKRLPDQPLSGKKSSGKEKPLKFRKLDVAPKRGMQRGDPVVNVLFPQQIATSGDDIEGGEWSVSHRGGHDGQKERNVAVAQDNIKEAHLVDLTKEKSSSILLVSKDLAQGLNKDLQNADSGSQLPACSLHLSEPAQKSQAASFVQSLNSPMIDTPHCNILEGLQTLDPIQVCVQGSVSSHSREGSGSQKAAEALKAKQYGGEQSCPVRKHRTENLFTQETSLSIREMTSHGTLTVGEVGTLEGNHHIPAGHSVSKDLQKQSVRCQSAILTPRTDSLQKFQENVSPSLQCDSNSAQQPQKVGERITIKASYQNESSKAGCSLPLKHIIATSKATSPIVSTPRAGNSRRDSPAAACEKQSLSNAFLPLSKSQNKELKAHEQKDDVRVSGREEQTPISKHQIPAFSEKPSARPFFPKNSQKSSVWSRSPNLRTWHRDKSSPLTSSDAFPNKKSPLSVSQFGQSANTTMSMNTAAYVRKGNSLVRASGIATNGTTLGSKSQLPPERLPVETLVRTSVLQSLSTANVSNSCSQTSSGACELIKNAASPPLVSDLVGSKYTAEEVTSVVSSDSPSAPVAELRPCCLLGGTLPSDIATQKDNPAAEVSAVAGNSGDITKNKVLDAGIPQSFEASQSGNNLVLPTMTRSYIRSKANQLVAAPLGVSDHMEVQTSRDSHEKHLPDLYVRKKSNQLVRNSFVAKTENEDMPSSIAIRSMSGPSRWGRKVKVSSMRSTKLGRVLSGKKIPGVGARMVWTLNNTSKECHGTSIKRSASSLVPWKKPGFQRGLRSRSLKSLPKGRKGSLLSLISRKLQSISQPLYTRSASGFSLHRSGVMSLGGANLKWTKSMEKNSKLAREEATKAVAAAAKQRREKKEAVAAAAKARSSRIVARKHACSSKAENSRRRIVLVGLVRYSMDPTKRTLQRLPESNEISSGLGEKFPCEHMDASALLTPRRASIGGALYVRVGNGNQLIRDPKTSIRALANEKVRWSLHNVRSRALKKQQYCQFFTRFGKCNKQGGRCPYIHDPEKVAVCTKFLKGACTNEKCILTHKVMPERMPDCSFFLQGLCTNEYCPYRHVNVNPKAPICEGFLKGYCIDGDMCNKKHTYVCLTYSETGSCPDRVNCKYHHPKKKERVEQSRTGQSIGAKRKRRYFSCNGLASEEVDTEFSPMPSQTLSNGGIPPDFESLDYIELGDVSQDIENIPVTGRVMAPLKWEELLFANYQNEMPEDFERLLKPAFVFG